MSRWFFGDGVDRDRDPPRRALRDRRLPTGPYSILYMKTLRNTATDKSCDKVTRCCRDVAAGCRVVAASSHGLGIRRVCSKPGDSVSTVSVAKLGIHRVVS